MICGTITLRPYPVIGRTVNPTLQHSTRVYFARCSTPRVASYQRRRCNTLITPSVGTTSSADPQSNVDATVTEVLQAIADTGTKCSLENICASHINHTDFGDNLRPEQRLAIDDALCTLEAAGKQQGSPLANPLIFGNFEVSYTSTQDNSPRMTLLPLARFATLSDHITTAAGGRFRSGLGKLLYKTTGLYQAVLRPDLVVNKLEFRLLGLLPGYVGLRGRLTPETADPRTVRVAFETPVISLLGLVLRIGPPSFVVLRCARGWGFVWIRFRTTQRSTTYLDERIRLGKGGRGTLFVFKRTENEAGMAEVGVVGSTPGAKVGAVLLAGLWGAGCGMLIASRRVSMVLIGVGLALLLMALLFTMWRGGQARDN